MEAVNNYVKNITEILEKTDHLGNGILLENSAKQGTELGYSLEELSYIYNQLDDSVRNRVGFCLDLCHIFVAGELDIRKVDAVDLFFDQFNQLIGLDKLKCIHYNDSSIPFGGCNDHHGDICCGYISNPLLGGNIDGFRRIASIAEDNNIAIIFETPCLFNQFHIGNQIFWQLEIVKGWANKNNGLYLKYIELHPELNQIAQNHYAKKKKPSKKKNDVDTEICKCEHQTPKIKIKIKLKPKIDGDQIQNNDLV